jgi:hypothetical protein
MMMRVRGMIAMVVLNFVFALVIFPILVVRLSKASKNKEVQSAFISTAEQG